MPGTALGTVVLGMTKDKFSVLMRLPTRMFLVGETEQMCEMYNDMVML